MHRPLLAVLPLLLLAGPSAAQDLYPVIGYVAMEDSLADRSGTVVTIEGAPEVDHVITDENGRFEVFLPVGTYAAKAVRVGYDSGKTPLLYVSGYGDRFDDLVLTRPGGTLTGRVLVDSEPRGNVVVCARDTQICAVTSTTGRYSLARVPQGSHTLVADLAGWRRAEVHDVTSAANRTTEAPTIHIDERDDREAKSFLLTPGEDQQLDGAGWLVWDASAAPDGARVWVSDGDVEAWAEVTDDHKIRIEDLQDADRLPAFERLWWGIEPVGGDDPGVERGSRTFVLTEDLCKASAQAGDLSCWRERARRVIIPPSVCDGLGVLCRVRGPNLVLEPKEPMLSTQ